MLGPDPPASDRRVRLHLPYGFSSIKLQAVTAAGAQFGPPGFETDLLYLACLAALVLAGSGPLAIDSLLAKRREHMCPRRTPSPPPDAEEPQELMKPLPSVDAGHTGALDMSAGFGSWLLGASALGAANQDLLRETNFERSELRSDFTPALSAGCDLFGATVQISPIELVKRHCMERYGIVTESIYAPTRSSIEISYGAPAHLLVLYEDGVRREGETSIDGLPLSTLRNFANKLILSCQPAIPIVNGMRPARPYA